LFDFTCENDEFCASTLILNAWAKNGSKGIADRLGVRRHGCEEQEKSADLYMKSLVEYLPISSALICKSD